MLLPGALSRTGWLSAAIVVGAVAVKAAYAMKSESADGRLLMWKIAWRASCGAPDGVGWEYLPRAYGNAQESYFAGGDGTERERKVAETPVYVFNENLQLALAFGRG